MQKLLSESSAERAMTIIDALLIDDVIQDAITEHSHTKMRASINKVYGRSRDTGSSEEEQMAMDYDYDRTIPPEYEEIGEEGLAGIPVMG